MYIPSYSTSDTTTSTTLFFPFNPKKKTGGEGGRSGSHVAFFSVAAIIAARQEYQDQPG
jgi:hypothetical protein